MCHFNIRNFHESSWRFSIVNQSDWMCMNLPPGYCWPRIIQCAFVKDVLHTYLCIASMFNGGQLHAMTIPPIGSILKTSKQWHALGTLISGNMGLSMQYILKSRFHLNSDSVLHNAIQLGKLGNLRTAQIKSRSTASARLSAYAHWLQTNRQIP